MNHRSTRGQLAQYRKHLQYEDRLDFQRYMRFAVYLRLFGYNYGVLYNPYDTDYAGFSVFLNRALRLDLASRSHCIDLQVGKRECTFPIATWVVVFVAKYVLGPRWYSDLLTALQEEHLRTLVGLEQLPSDRSISRAHEDIHPRVMKRAYWSWTRELHRQGQMSGWLIAIDSTFLIVYGKTYQHVGWSYEPKGRKGYRLTIAYDVVSCQPICFLLAPANRSDSKMLLKTVNEVERFLDPNPDRIYLFDKGYWKGANFQVLDEKGIRFVTQVKWYANITRTLDTQLAADPMRGRQVVELVANANGQDVPGFKGLLRVIAIDDRRGKLAQREAEKEDPDDTSDEVQDGKARPLLPVDQRLGCLLHRLARYHDRRWEIEEFIRQAKQSWHLNTFCNTDHNAIKTHIWLLFYSYSLIRIFRRQVMGQAGWSKHAAGWLRRHLFIRSGRVWPLPGGGVHITFSHPRQHDPGLIAFLAWWCHKERVRLMATFILLALILEATTRSQASAQPLIHTREVFYPCLLIALDRSHWPGERACPLCQASRTCPIAFVSDLSYENKDTLEHALFDVTYGEEEMGELLEQVSAMWEALRVGQLPNAHLPLDHWYHNYCPYLDICSVGQEAVRYQREHRQKLPDEVLAKIIGERIVRKRRREKAGKKRQERSLAELAEELGWG